MKKMMSLMLMLMVLFTGTVSVAMPLGGPIATAEQDKDIPWD